MIYTSLTFSATVPYVTAIWSFIESIGFQVTTTTWGPRPRIDPTKEICQDHHIPDYSNDQKSTSPYNMSAEWGSHKYMSVIALGKDSKTKFKGIMCQVAHEGVPIGRLSDDFEENVIIECPPFRGEVLYLRHYFQKYDLY